MAIDGNLHSNHLLNQSSNRSTRKFGNIFIVNNKERPEHLNNTPVIYLSICNVIPNHEFKNSIPTNVSLILSIQIITDNNIYTHQYQNV